MHILNPRFEFLTAHELNFTSQFGEDGLIAAMLERIGMKNRWCFEVGAADGEFVSNTKRLRNAGWTSVLIECAERWLPDLRKLANERTFVIERKIEPDSLDEILTKCGAPEDMDLGVIDIDGQDYWCWKGMQKYRPRLMLVEFAPNNPDHLIPLGVNDHNQQSGLNVIVNLGIEKGYVPLIGTHCNVLFCREDELK